MLLVSVLTCVTSLFLLKAHLTTLIKSENAVKKKKKNTQLKKKKTCFETFGFVAICLSLTLKCLRKL